MVGDELVVATEDTASLVENGIEIVERLEVAVDDGFVDEHPEMFSRL